MKKKIIRIVTRLNVGGVSIHVVRLCLGLKDDFENILVCGQIEDHEGDMSYYAKQNNVSFYKIDHLRRELSFKNDIIALWKLYKLIRKEKPDIVETHTAKAGTLGRIAAFLARVPHINYTFHGNLFSDYFSVRKAKFFVFVERVLSKITTKIITNSEQIKQDLINRKIAKEDKITIIRYGFDFSNVIATDSEKGCFRTKYNIPSDTLLLGIVGRITPIKNHHLFIEIAHKLLSLYPDSPPLYFAIIGDGDLKDEIQNEINSRNLKERVFITGFIKDLKMIYADMDIVLLTSKSEGTPFALIEGMANGKIVLSTNVGAINEFIDNKINGFYFDQDNPDLFVETIRDLIENKYDTKSICENAKRTVFEMFSIEKMISDFKTLYQNSSTDCINTVSKL